MADGFTVRTLKTDDCTALFVLRLEALEAHPNYFLKTVADEKQRGLEHWVTSVNDPTCGIFGLFDGTQLIGITGIFPKKGDETGTHAFMGMSYIKPAYRKRGLSHMLYQARIDWAIAHPKIQILHIGHRRGNDASRKAMEAFGFKRTGAIILDWPNGSRDVEYKYQLDLNTL